MLGLSFGLDGLDGLVIGKSEPTKKIKISSYQMFGDVAVILVSSFIYHGELPSQKNSQRYFLKK